MKLEGQDENMNSKLLHGDLTGELLAAFYTVYNELGYGFLESVHKNALSVELEIRNLKVQREIPIEIVYMGKPVGRFRIDMLVDNKVLVEVKSASAISDAATRQLFTYLRATRIQVGLLLHYGPRPAHNRFAWTGKEFNSKS